MIFQNIFRYTGLVLLSGFISCNDFLEEKPKSEMNTDQFFSSAQHAYSAVNSLYRTGVPEFYNAGSAYMGPTIMLDGYLSGFFDNEYKGQEVVILYCQNLNLTSKNSAGVMDGVWDPCYRAISRANFAIKNIARTPGLSDTEKNQLLATARFFRAMNYFHLVKFFGDVPLITDPYESLDNLYVAREPSSNIYKLIIEDLIFSVENGELKDEAFTKNGFKISKGTVQTLLANVYLNLSGYPLQENNYANAAAVAREVINSGKYALIENGNTPETTAYNTIRTTDDSNEYIYSIEYDATIASAGWRPTYSFPNKAATWGVFKYSITCNAYRPVDEFLNIYNPKSDLRIQEKQFFHSSFTYTKNDKEITENFITSPYIWYNEEAMLQTGRSGKDVVVYRYPEVLLIAAEAIAKTEGVTAEAAEYLAQVKARASLNETKQEITNSLIAMNTEDFIEEIWSERLREFPLENKVWWDIQRTRKYPKTDSNNKGFVSFINVIGAKNPWGSIYNEANLLWPISDNEIQRNPNLSQNEGY
ncbi:MAG TPA: RagB/SusD family nutrient uptake outer membrane protein [Porphyromonadaceae bacterium]|nr:RagB/SusD family nutrient uptake outer membrane protein [Porphyromonadaceae bacterium]